ncbi:phosphotransferase enzyme family protein [Rhizoctonia solani AG-3 Rhs1AP]|uniref:Phosphotransferase enzyme family protein n=1 Tax=Rhizoctonia solani AG-3 Rhs1AP TaxID=1086054 RepID=X8JG29_9AGAM|nr:phosphotransferase enzyme family protein [Rhizoctonia solani AG-3 Rhs1AP]
MLVAPHTLCTVPEALIAEALSMHMVRTMTTIPVPPLKQLIAGAEIRRHYLVMDYIPGRALNTCWSELGFFAQLRIAWILRGYVSQLRRLQRSVPGRIDGSECEGHLWPIIGEDPFESYEHLASWYNHKIDVSHRAGKAPATDFRYDTSWPLVFTHGDISPRNIILADDGLLYLIDWRFAGFYPVWHEHTSMVWDSSDFQLPSSWQRWISFIAGESVCS